MAAKKKKAQGKPLFVRKEGDSASRLPFEPVQTRQKPAKQAASGAANQSEAAQAIGKTTAPSKTPLTKHSSNVSTIPEIVNRRMVARAALFCGIPTAMALLTFVASYLAIANDIFQPPTAAVLLVSLGFFGLGVMGLSYGPLSASWDEDRIGNPLGLDEFKLNFGRLRDSWRASKASKDD